MLVIISDLHLTDGTSGSTISPGAFVIFAERLRELAIRASWRSDGRYRPVPRIDLLLLGDVLDIIRSTQWLDGPPRPWDSPQGPLAHTVARITGDILHHNTAALQVLRGLSGEGAIRIPPANAAGQPAHGSQCEPVEVRIHYLVGNHDWFLHLPGANYDRLRQSVVQHLGLDNRADRPFAHDPLEDPAIYEVLARHRVFARHGDVFDPFNFEGDRNASSLGDAIVVDLVNRFAVEVAKTLAHDLPAATVAGLREIDNVRPLLLVPLWLQGLLDRTCPLPAQQKQVKAVWDRLADEFLEMPWVRQRDSWRPGEIVDGLQKLLRFSRLPVSWSSAVASWLASLRCDEGSYLDHALAEREFRNRFARYIVYGHTHQVEAVPLDVSYTESGTFEQVYFNTGTWRRVYRQARWRANECEFIPHDVMNYLVFFQGDERDGRPYESWCGHLGLQSRGVNQYRVDAAGSLSGPHFPTASAVHEGRPHFTLSPAASQTADRTQQR